MPVRNLLRCIPVAAVLVLGACSHTAQRYTLSAENLVAQQEIKKSSGASVQVAQALGPATQDFLKKTFVHPSFREMFQGRKQ